MNNKIKVTFSVAPRINLSFVNFASQIMTTNLLRNKNLQVLFDYIVPVENELYEKNKNDIHKLYGLEHKNMKTKFFLHTRELIPGMYKKHINEAINSEYVIVSLANLSGGVFYVKNLLECGKKVIIGGAAVNFVTPNSFRDVLISKMNTDKDLVMNNLIIVRGYADLYTNFYEIIKNWKDVEIPNDSVNFISMYECDDNYLAPYYNELSFILTFLYIGCQWRKCKFCWMSIKNNIYKKNLDLSKIITKQHLKKYFEICKKLYPKTNQLYIGDNYISKHMIDFIKEVDVSEFQRVIAITGIRQLLDEEYCNKLFTINKKMLMVVGFDFINEFSLKFMNKGYEIKDIFKAIDNIKKYQKKYNTDLIIKGNRILDSPMDFYYRHLEEIENFNKIKESFENTDIEYIDCAYSQMIYPGSYLDNVESKYYKKVEDHRNPNTSGNIHILLSMLNGNYKLLDELKYFVKPFVRYDENGKIIKSCIEH